MTLITAISIVGLLGTADAMPGLEKRGVVVPSVTPAMNQSPHSTASGSSAGPTDMAGVIQKAILPGYPKMPIGEAFGKYGYFKKREWRETRAANGNIFVDFVGYIPTGLFDFKKRSAGITARGIEVKFVIYPDGAYGLAMMTNVEIRSGGRIYRTPRADAKVVLDAIYANQKLDL